MATKTSCRTDTSSNALADIKAALTAAGLITATLYYDASQYLIFSTPISSKVIKIYIRSDRVRIEVYYGDAWTSGETITNAVKIAGTSGSTMNSLEIVTAATFFALFYYNNGDTRNTMAYVGALDNGDELTFGLAGINGSDGGNICLCRNVTDSVTLMPVSGIGEGTSGDLKDSSGNLITIPLMFVNSGVLEMNGTDPAAAVGVKMSSVKNLSTTVVTGGAGFVLFQSTTYSNSASATRCSVLCEYTP